MTSPPPAFDGFVGIDWSGATGRYEGIAVARCDAGTAPQLVPPPAGARRWTRQAVLDWLLAEVARDRRLLVGLDLAFALPGLEGTAFDLWAAVDAHCGADADLLGHRYIERDPRFWRSGRQPADWAARAPHRATELACRDAGFGNPQSTLQLIGAKQVGKGALAGMRLLHRLRGTRGEGVAVWPFEPLPKGDEVRSVVVEIYPRLFIRKAGLGNGKLRSVAAVDQVLRAFDSAASGLVATPDDHEADALVSAAGLRALHADAAVWQAGDGRREGWIFGVPAP